jgi:serpin B
MLKARSVLWTGVLLSVCLWLLCSCVPPQLEPDPPSPEPSGENVCTDRETQASMSLERAMQLATDSECSQEGQLAETGVCNDDTGAWWIDLKMDKPGCNPACVINLNDDSVEISYRCTGALPVAEVHVASSKPRLDASSANEADVGELSSGNGRFAFDLFHAVQDTEGNLFFSPYSVSAALAMTYAGSRGETEAEMAQILHYTLPRDRLHGAFNSLDQTLSERGEGSQGKDDKRFRLNIVNAIWGQTGYVFLEQFLDLLAENYGAGLRLLDFSSAPEEARVTINEWVSEQTEARIPELIGKELIDELTRLVLTNAIYFNAAWQYPFVEEMTVDGPFCLLDGSTQTVPVMSQTESFGYFEGNEFIAVELPYDGMELSMLAVLPEKGMFDQVQDELSEELVQTITGGFQYRPVALSMPKFEFDSDLSLADTLAAMGMPAAFGGAADFSGMTGECDLFISDVIHKAFVSVDEAGTEAAAATAVIMKRLGLPEAPVQVSLDRPFLFLIRDIETNTVLFFGRVLSIEE